MRAPVNTGRKPLADSLGLALPDTLAEERDMWAMVSRLSRIPHHERAAALDRFRATGQAELTMQRVRAVPAEEPS